MACALCSLWWRKWRKCKARPPPPPPPPQQQQHCINQQESSAAISSRSLNAFP
jgi:hypothetical protein